MSLLCARIRCGDDAAASLLFDAPGSRVLIIDLAESFAGIPLCAEHARTRTAPMGWTMVDERTQPARVASRPRASATIGHALPTGKTRLRTVPATDSFSGTDSFGGSSLADEAPVNRPTLRRPLERPLPEPEPIAKRRAAKKAAAKALRGQTEIPGLESQNEQVVSEPALEIAEPASIEVSPPEPAVVELAIVESLVGEAPEPVVSQPFPEAAAEAVSEQPSESVERVFPWERAAGDEAASLAVSDGADNAIADGSLLTELIPSDDFDPDSAIARSRRRQDQSARPTSRLLSRAFRVRD